MRFDPKRLAVEYYFDDAVLDGTRNRGPIRLLKAMTGQP
jgi:hypothetical protein